LSRLAKTNLGIAHTRNSSGGRRNRATVRGISQKNANSTVRSFSRFDKVCRFRVIVVIDCRSKYGALSEVYNSGGQTGHVGPLWYAVTKAGYRLRCCSINHILCWKKRCDAQEIANDQTHKR